MKRTRKNKQLRLRDDPVESIPEYKHIRSKLSYLTAINQSNFDITLVFSILFREIFWNDTPNYELSAGNFGATRSNWTYHTAMAVAQTCKIMDLTCKFEALGKRDAIIETRNEVPEIILIAEWEWDYEDIFGKGKELEKLKASCKASETADGLLLIYCPESEYLNLLQGITKDWIGATKKIENPPSLFLHTILFKERVSYREFSKLATVEINPSHIKVWNELGYAEEDK